MGEPLDPTPPDTLPEILPDTMPPDISPDAPVPPWEEKRGDGDPAPPRGERTEDGDRYAPVPNVDPGGRQRPEVIGTLCGCGRFKDPSRSRIRISDRRKYRSYRGRFRHGPHGHGPSSEGGVTGQTETASRSPTTTRL